MSEFFLAFLELLGFLPLPISVYFANLAFAGIVDLLLGGERGFFFACVCVSQRKRGVATGEMGVRDDIPILLTFV